MIGGNAAAAAPHLALAADGGEKMVPMPGWVNPAEFAAGVALQKTGKRQEAIAHYKAFLDRAPPSSPDRRDALAALGGTGRVAVLPEGPLAVASVVAVA